MGIACLIAVAPAAAQSPDPGGDPDADAGVPPAEGYFGLNGVVSLPGDAPPPVVAGLAAKAGANALRVPLSWQAIEPQRDRWSAASWKAFDDVYAAARAHGVTPIMVLENAPWWARTLVGQLCLSNTLCAYPPRPAMDGEWAQFAAEAARRYPDAIFEIWNEPNLWRYWASGPDPSRYARLQVVAYDAIKAVNPDAMVLSGGFANNAEGGLLDGLLQGIPLATFVRRAYAAPSSIKGHVDALAFHPYPGRARETYTGPLPDLGPGSTFARGFAELRAARDAAGDGATPLFVTETGISTTEGVDRAQQVTATQRIYRKVLTMDDVLGVVFHRMNEPVNAVLNTKELGFAWLGQATSSTPRTWPVYCAFVAAAGNSHAQC